VDTGECLSVLDREAILLRRGVWLAFQRDEERVAALNYEMHVREVAHERAKALLDAIKGISEPPAPPLPSGTLCSGKTPLPDVVVGGREDGEEKV
jgi:hypothetical protein